MSTRAADDFETIRTKMGEIYAKEDRRPLSCVAGQHNFMWSDGAYTCTICLRGKPEDGR